MSVAYIFPGQGSQYAGMGRNLAENSSVAREVFEEADEVLGFSLSRLCFEGSAEELQSTENTQPAILAVSIAAWRVVKATGFPSPNYVAGHSLGEYSALVAASALTLASALKTVRARGRYMQEAVPLGAGAMAAVGAELQVVMEVCAQSQQYGICALANINSPRQIVIAGDVAAVDFAIELLTEQGIRRVKKLNVSAPFHCALMRPAEERLASELAAIEFRDLGVPLVTNVDATLISRGTEARDALRRQVSATVRWQESVELLRSEGVTMFVEVGPGKVLSGLARHIEPDALCMNVEDEASLHRAQAIISERAKSGEHAAANA
ncbi:MAG: ACP S-malonyltransferase [Pyrinomonadaceae bacterium]|nr:ACP S-malonyltransferase [Pyrinomonadaceae bacterium]